MVYQSVNSYDGTILKTSDEFTDQQLETALETIVAKAATLMREQIEAFALPMSLEMGKLIDQAREEVLLSADILDYYAKNAVRFLAPKQLKPASHLSRDI